jgi:putative SOS response-associated peptidase YedK
MPPTDDTCMCARFTLTTSPAEVAGFFGLDPGLTAGLVPRYNVAPAQLVAVVGLKPDGKTRGLALLRWGFVPRWAADPDSGPRPVNAKAETVATRAPFKDSFRDRRCLVPADGFYEWLAEGGKKVARHFRLRSDGPFAFAGVWDSWQQDGREPVRTCALITVPANEAVRPVHDRMPAILTPDRFDSWLNPATPLPALLALLIPLPADLLEAVRVGPAVNRVANDGPECLTPAA